MCERACVRACVHVCMFALEGFLGEIMAHLVGETCYFTVLFHCPDEDGGWIFLFPPFLKCGPFCSQGSLLNMCSVAIPGVKVWVWLPVQPGSSSPKCWGLRSQPWDPSSGLSVLVSVSAWICSPGTGCDGCGWCPDQALASAG